MTEQLTDSLAQTQEQRDRELYIARASGVARALMQSHVEAPNSNMVLLPDSGGTGDGRHPLDCYADGNPLPTSDVDKVADVVIPGFQSVLEKLRSAPGAGTIIEETGELLDSGRNIWVTTLHVGDIKDIAVALKLTGNLLSEQGYKPDHTVSVISKAAAEAGFVFHPEGADQPVTLEVVPTLQILCDRIFLPWPKTKSSQAVLNELPETEVKRHNREGVIGGIKQMLDQGGVIGALAPTGTTRLSQDEAGRFKISPVNDSTIELMRHDKTHILPMLVWLAGEEPITHLCGPPVKIERAAQADEVMQLMTTAMQERVDDKEFVYESRPRR